MSTPHELSALEREQVLQQRLSPDELRELLKRLELHEAGEPGMPTVAEVAEAIGKDPMLVATVLAELRRQTLPQTTASQVEQSPLATRRSSRKVVRVLVVVFMALLVLAIVGQFMVASLLNRIASDALSGPWEQDQPAGSAKAQKTAAPRSSEKPTPPAKAPEGE